jgi:large subunit ribosomal protein L15
MVKLHDLQPDKGSKKRKQRVGRGISAGQGKTAGRGTKGAGARGRHARKGAYFEGGQLPLVRRLPFKRGFTNIFRIDYQEANVGDIAGLELAAGTVVDAALLAEIGIIRDADKPLVILGDGELNTRLTFKANRFTKSAEAKITAAGGTVEKVPLKVTGARATVKLLSKEQLAALDAQNAE